MNKELILSNLREIVRASDGQKTYITYLAETTIKHIVESNVQEDGSQPVDAVDEFEKGRSAGIEEAAKLCDVVDKSEHPSDIANAIRDLLATSKK